MRRKLCQVVLQQVLTKEKEKELHASANCEIERRNWVYKPDPTEVSNTPGGMDSNDQVINTGEDAHKAAYEESLQRGKLLRG